MMDGMSDFEMDSQRFQLGYISGLKFALSLTTRHGSTVESIKAAIEDVILIHSKEDA